MEKNIGELTMAFNAVVKFINILKERWYPGNSILQDINISNSDRTIDIVITEVKSAQVVAAIEVKVLRGNFTDNINKLDELKKIAGNVLHIIKTKYLPNIRTFSLIVDNQGNYKIYEYKFFSDGNISERLTSEIDIFPSYEEMTSTRKSENILEKKIEKKIEIKEINKKYELFKIICPIISILLLVVFLFNIFKCQYLPIEGWYLKVCDLNIEYPDLILIWLSFVIFLLSLLTKVKTTWFEIDWTKNNEKI